METTPDSSQLLYTSAAPTNPANPRTHSISRSRFLWGQLLSLCRFINEEEPPEMPSFFDLPNEVLCQVIGHLEVPDLDALYAIPPFKKRLGSTVVCLVVDSDTVPTYSNIPRAQSVSDFLQKVEEYKKILHCVVLEISAFETIDLTIITSQFINHIILQKHNSQQRNHRQPSNKALHSAIDRYATSLTLTVTLSNESYTLVKSNLLNDYNICFPNAKHLTLCDCPIPSRSLGRRIPCPVLESLQTMETPIEDLLAILDCPPNLKTLNFSSPDGHVDLNVLPLHVLTHCHLANLNTHVIENLTLPNLQDLSLEGPYIFRYLDFANLKRISITSGMSTLIHHLSIPEVTEMHLSVLCFRGLFNVCSPKLKSVAILINPSQKLIEDTRHDQKMDYSFLEPVETLRLGDFSYETDFNYGICHAPLLTEQLIVPAFIHLNELDVAHDLTPDTISHLPPSHMLTKLAISKISISSDINLLSLFTAHYPKLEVLTVEMVFVVSVNGTADIQTLDPIYPHLKEVSVRHDGKLGLQIQTSCPYLTSFSFYPLVPSPLNTRRVSTGSTIFSLDAPKLTHLTLRYLRGFDLDVSGYPLLEALVAEYCLSSLSFGNPARSQLIELSVRGNPDLRHIDAMRFPKLRTYKTSLI